MKKILSASLSCVLAFLFAVMCFAVGSNGSSVYVSDDDREKLSYMLENNSVNIRPYIESDGYKILTETISQVYYVDLLSFSKTNELEIKPVDLGKEGTRLYIAKVLDKDDNFVGNMRFTVVDDTAYHSLFTYVSKNEEFSSPASCSYADHVERIQRCLKEDSPVPETDVTFVTIEWLGTFFYINNEKHNVFVGVGDLNAQNDYVLNIDQLKEIADKRQKEYEAFLAAKEEWEKNHPGEEYLVYGGEYQTDALIESSDITDMEEETQQLSHQTDEAAETTGNGSAAADRKQSETSENDNGFPRWIIIVAAAVIIALIIMLSFVFAGRNQKTVKK